MCIFSPQQTVEIDQIAKSFGLWGRTGNHNALDDAMLTARIFGKMLAKLRGQVKDTGELLSMSRMM
jgi:inhibitor of KinA sporulation pathway (predicted exonuclease)